MNATLSYEMKQLLPIFSQFFFDFFFDFIPNFFPIFFRFFPIFSDFCRLYCDFFQFLFRFFPIFSSSYCPIFPDFLSIFADIFFRQCSEFSGAENEPAETVGYRGTVPPCSSPQNWFALTIRVWGIELLS